jgi:hypothetical protein
MTRTTEERHARKPVAFDRKSASLNGKRGTPSSFVAFERPIEEGTGLQTRRHKGMRNYERSGESKRDDDI